MINENSPINLISIEQFRKSTNSDHLTDDEVMEIIKSLGAFVKITIRVNDMDCERTTKIKK